MPRVSGCAVSVKMLLREEDDADVTQHHDLLATRLAIAFKESGATVESIAERTKIPKSTIRWLLGDSAVDLLPERAYLRGHLANIAKEVGVPVDEVLGAFDVAHPKRTPDEPEFGVRPRLSAGIAAVVAGLGCIAIVTVILAFVR